MKNRSITSQLKFVALSGLLLMASGNAAAEDLGWLAGPWQVEYTDKVLGNVVGVADVRLAGSTTTTGPVFTGNVVVFGPDLKRYELRIEYFRIEDDRVQIHLKGDSPPSGVQALSDFIRGDVEIIPGQVGDVVRAAWGEARHNSNIVPGIEQDLYVEFPIPADGEAETLAGKWHYSPGMISQIPANRGGNIEDDTVRINVSGRERWTRPDAQVTAVVAESDVRVDALGESLPPLTAPFWISAAGFGLPVQPKRNLVVQSLSGNLLPRGAWRVHPEHPDAIQFLASINRNMLPDPVPLTVNGAKGHWLPVMPGIEPQSIRIVRQYSDTEFFAVDQAYAGDLVFIEAEYAEPLFTDVLRYGVLTDDLYPIMTEAGSGEDVETDTELSFQRHLETVSATAGQDIPERTEIQLRRTANAAIYRSAPLLVKPSDASDLPRYVNLTGRSEQSVTARSDVDELLVWEIDPVAHSNSKKIVTVPVIKRPDTTLWPDALHTAQQCRADGKSETLYWNIDYFNAVINVARATGIAGAIPDPRRNQDVLVNEEITLKDHAAALLLRRELVRKIEEQRAYYRSPNGVSDAEIENMIYRGFRRDFHPLFSFEIDVPTNNAYAQHFAGFKWPLRMLFRRDVFELRFNGDEKAYHEFLKLAVANAAGLALDATDRAMQHAIEADDCDVLKLLMVSGRSMSGLVDIVRPRLVKENPAPDGVPRFIQDRDALRSVTGVETKQASIEGIEALSNAELDIVLLAATLGASGGEMLLAKAGTRALTAMRAARLAGTTLDLIDDIRLLQQVSNLKGADEEVELARGIIGIVGDSRYVKAVESQTSAYWGAATAFSLRFLTVALAAPSNIADNWKYKYHGLSLLVRPETTSMIAHKAAVEGLDSLNRFDRAFLNALARRLPEDAARFTDLDRSIAQLYGRGDMPAEATAAPSRGAVGDATGSADSADDIVIDGARLQQLNSELQRQGLSPAEADALQSSAVRDADIVGAEAGATLTAIRQSDSAEQLASGGLSDDQVSEALEQLRVHNEASAAAPAANQTMIPEAELETQLAALGYEPQQIDALVARNAGARADLGTNQTAIRVALDDGRSVESLIDQGYTPRDILAELDYRRVETYHQRLQAELAAIDRKRSALPDLTERLFANDDIDAVAVLRAQGRSDDEIVEDLFNAFAKPFDGNPPPFLQGQFADQLMEAFGDDFDDAWVDAFTPRFMNLRRSSAAGDTALPGAGAASGAATPDGRTFISVYNNGERVDIPVGPLIARGSYNAVYAHPTNPRYVIRVNFNPGSRALDDLGADALRGTYLLDDGGMLRGPRRRMALSGDCDDDFRSLADDLNDWYGLKGTNAFRREELLDIFARRNNVEYIEIAQGRLAGTFTEWQNAKLTPGQALEVYRNLRRLNDAGHVLLDSHGGNLHFERVPGTADEWRMHIIDSGSVVSVRGDTAAERAARAAEMQRTVTAPGGTAADRLYAATGHEQRFALERTIGLETRETVYEGLDDATQNALGSAEQLVFVPQLARFPKVRDLLLMTDAERAAALPPDSLDLVR